MRGISAAHWVWIVRAGCSPVIRGSCRGATEGASWTHAALAPSVPSGHLPRIAGEELERTRRSVSRVLFRPLRSGDDHSSRPAIAGRLSRPTRTLSASDGLSDARSARGPYSVLLQAGLAMPSLSPGPRWALTPPFHPSRPVGRRFAFCGAIPGIAPGGRYPPPCHRGARTFLGVRRRRDRPTIWSGVLVTDEALRVNPGASTPRSDGRPAPAPRRGGRRRSCSAKA